MPAFNGQTKLDPVEGRKVLLDVMRDLGDHAQKSGTRVLLEPLNRGEAWFLRMLADAAAIPIGAARVVFVESRPAAAAASVAA